MVQVCVQNGLDYRQSTKFVTMIFLQSSGFIHPHSYFSRTYL